MPDNPLESATLAKLGKVEYAGPYVYTCRNGKDSIEFPDLTAMDWDEAEEFMADIQGQPRKVWMPKYLGAADLKKFEAEKLKFAEAIALIRDLVSHYQAITGDQGEGAASRP